MDFAELKTKNTAELKDLLSKEQSHIYRLRQQVRTNALKQHHTIAQTRKTIARLMLLLSNSR